MTLEEQISSILEAARNEIRENMAAKGINASGRTSASLRVRTVDGHIQLVGGTDGVHALDNGIQTSDTAPIPTLEIGREGGAVPRGFYYIIKEWSREKGIQFDKESERSTFAYFVAKKIAREGTMRHSLPEDVYSTPANKAVGRISEVVKTYAAGRIFALGASTQTAATHF